MSKTIVLQLDDADYERLLQEADAKGRKFEEVALQRLWSAGVQEAGAGALPQVSLAVPLAINGANSDWEPLLQRFAQDQAAQRGGTPEFHLAQLPFPGPGKTMQGDSSETLSSPSGLSMSAPLHDPVLSHFGTFASGDPHSADNDRLDAELARCYLAELEEPEEAP